MKESDRVYLLHSHFFAIEVNTLLPTGTMHPTKKSFLFLLLISIIHPIFSFETYENKKVGQIDVIFEKQDPEHPFDTKSVLSRLKTRNGDPFSQLTFDRDLKSLSDEYDKVEPLIYLKNNEIYITLRLWPLPMIHSIKWEGNERIKTKKLQKELDVKPFTIFSRPDFNKKFNKVKEFYIKKGYFESQLTYSTHPIPNTNQVDILITVHESRPGKIKKIVFKGFTRSERNALMDMMYTKKYNFLTNWLTGTGTFREDALEQDKMQILNYLHNRGYADALLDIKIKDAPASGKIIIEVTAHRGVQYKFGNISFEGNALLSNEEIDKRILIRSGETFSPERIRETSQRIKDFYGQKGYIEANVYYETHLMENEPVYDVKFFIDEGEQYKIGLVRIFGNSNTKNHVILRESLLVPGELFDSRKLKATQTRLENIGYFKSVNVYAVRSSDDLGLGSSYRDVYIEVEETTTGNVSLFLGFSTVDDIFGGLELTERNFNIKGFTQTFRGNFSALRGGGEYLHIRASLGKRQTNYLISWMDPYFRDTLWRFGFEVSRTTSRLQSEDYDIETLGFSLFAFYPVSNYWTVGTKYRLRNTDNRVQSKAGEEAVREFDQRGIISGLNASLGYDSTDSGYKPHRGLRSYLEAEFIGLGGDFLFLKFAYLNALYIPVWSKGTLKGRADFHFINPLGRIGRTRSRQEKVPLSERFFLGGETTVRGYKPYSIGPQTPNGDPTGGISSGLLSVEYCQAIFKLLDLFAFFDTGSVSDKAFKIPKLRMSYGVGARLELMSRTPIILGYGIPINPRRKDDGKKFFFSMGGQF